MPAPWQSPWAWGALGSTVEANAPNPGARLMFHGGEDEDQP